MPRWIGALSVAFTGLLGLSAAPSAQAAPFDWSTPSCLSADCTQMGSVTRYANAVGGGSPRDILLTVVSGTSGATVNQAPGTQMAYLSTTRVFNGRIAGNSTAGAMSQLVMRLTFVTPGTTTPNPLTGPIYLTSHDTDGNGNPSLGVRERVEFISPPATYVAGAQLVQTTALNSGIAYATGVCANNTDDGCSNPATGVSEGTGAYVNYSDLSVAASVAVTAWYTGAVTSIDFAYGAEVGSTGVGTAPISNRLFGLSGGTADAADMSAAFGNIPSVIRPGQVLTGLTLTCTNSSSASAAAVVATCVPTVSVGSVSAVSCSPASGSSNIAAGASIVCSFTYTAPGVQGGADETTTGVTFTGTTWAGNDTNSANNTTTAPSSIIDAVDDTDTKPGGATGQTTTLSTNDQYPVGSTFSFVAGGSCLNGSVSAAGVATYDVPVTGNCTLQYQLCAPAPNASTCDQEPLRMWLLFSS
jgi:hypothetical protein